ncbi:hypothetical protein V8O11_09170 [Erwinia aphidicola]|uniref:hypothetical protein n=1 Tax=Erwinia aphidicola TaxID=68334 RepID=UPI00300C9EC1
MTGEKKPTHPRGLVQLNRVSACREQAAFSPINTSGKAIVARSPAGNQRTKANDWREMQPVMTAAALLYILIVLGFFSAMVI